MGSLLKPIREYEVERESLGSDDRKRLELQEQEIASGTEDYRAIEHQGIRIHYFDYGFIAFRPVSRDLTELIAFKLFDRL